MTHGGRATCGGSSFVWGTDFSFLVLVLQKVPTQRKAKQVNARGSDDRRKLQFRNHGTMDD